MHSKFLILFKQYPPYIIDLISFEGISNLLITSSVILMFLIIGRYINNSQKYLLAKTVSLITIFFTITNHVIDLNNGNWEIQEDLPLHLCSVSNL